MGWKKLFVKDPDDAETGSKEPVPGPMRSSFSRAVPREAPPPPVRSGVLHLSRQPISSVGAPKGKREPDPDLLRSLDDRLAAVETPGYAEFERQSRALKEYIPDNGALVRAAVSSVSALGIDGATLLKAVQDRLRCVDDFRKETEATLANEARQERESGAQRLNDAQAQLVSLEAELARIQQERTRAEEAGREAKEALESLDAEVALGKERIETVCDHRHGELMRVMQDLQGSLTPAPPQKESA